MRNNNPEALNYITWSIELSIYKQRNILFNQFAYHN